MGTRKSYPVASAMFASIFLLTLYSTSASAVTYVGQWNNTTFGSFGDALIDIAISAPNYTMTIDLDGNVFGGSNPPPIMFAGVLNGGGGADINIIGDPLFGDITGSVTPTGIVDVVASNLPAPFIELLETSGTIDASAIMLDYFILFSGGQRPENGGTEGFDWAQGTLNANAVVVPLPAAMWLFAASLVAFGSRRRREAEPLD